MMSLMLACFQSASYKQPAVVPVRAMFGDTNAMYRHTSMSELTTPNTIARRWTMTCQVFSSCHGWSEGSMKRKLLPRLVVPKAADREADCSITPVRSDGPDPLAGVVQISEEPLLVLEECTRHQSSHPVDGARAHVVLARQACSAVAVVVGHCQDGCRRECLCSSSRARTRAPVHDRHRRDATPRLRDDHVGTAPHQRPASHQLLQPIADEPRQRAAPRLGLRGPHPCADRIVFNLWRILVFSLFV